MTISTPSGYTRLSTGQLVPTQVAQAQASYAASHPSSGASSGGSDVHPIISSSTSVSSGVSGVNPIGGILKNWSPPSIPGTLSSMIVQKSSAGSGSGISPIGKFYDKSGGGVVSSMVGNKSDVGGPIIGTTKMTQLSTVSQGASAPWSQAAQYGRGTVTYEPDGEGGRILIWTQPSGKVVRYTQEEQDRPWVGGSNTINPLNPNFLNAIGSDVPDTIAQAGGMSNFRTILQNKYPYLNSNRIDELVGWQLVKEGQISAYDYAGMSKINAPGVTREGYDYTQNAFWISQGNQPAKAHSEQVAAFNYATNIDNATSRAYQSALAADRAAGLNPPDYSAGYTAAPKAYTPGTPVSNYYPTSGVSMGPASGGGIEELIQYENQNHASTLIKNVFGLNPGVKQISI